MSRRLLLALGAFVIWTLITLVGGRLRNGGEAELMAAVTQGINPVFVLAAGFLLAIALWQGWRDLGLERAPALRSLPLLWLPYLYILGALALAATQGPPPLTLLLLLLVNTFFVGLSEELMFRGVLLQALRGSMAIWPAVLLTSLLFGGVHSLNVFVTGDLAAALLQSSAAFLSGLLFTAIRLRTGSLWPAVVTHGLWDFANFVLIAAFGVTASAKTAPTAVEGLLPALLVLPNALYGLWLMRHLGRTHARPED